MSEAIEIPYGVERPRTGATRELRGPWGWCGFVALAFVFIFSVTAPTPARAQSEDQIKAAFLLNFARYVEWPESAFSSPDASLQLCLAVNRDFLAVMSETVNGKTVGTRSVEVRAFEPGAPSAPCHLLFVDGVDRETETALLTEVSGRNVFTVGNSEGFAARGGIANFYRAGNKIRFEVKPDAARAADLKVSSRLLRLARIVE